MQMVYAKSELWKAGSLMPDSDSNEVKAMTEKVMAMSFTASSQIAQRLANALVQLFSKMIEDDDTTFVSALAESNPRFAEWLEHRRTLGGDQYGSFARLFEML
eukprot:1387043-Prymnesium_polylepis.1